MNSTTMFRPRRKDDADVSMRAPDSIPSGLIRPAAAALLWLIAATAPSPAAADTILVDFEALTPRDTGLGGDFWVENPGFSTAGTTFSGGSWQGFVVSSSTVTGTGGYFYSQNFSAGTAAAEISAEANGGAGGGVGGGQFAVGYGAGSWIDLPAGYRPAGLYATNVATTAWLLANPDPNGVSHPLGDGDVFSVIFRGWSQSGAQGTPTGSVPFMLGSQASGTRTIATEWTQVDLTGLGAAASISLDFAFNDFDPADILLPTYVALDNLTVTAVPEPSAIMLLACAAVAGLVGGRWRNRAA